MTFCDGYVEPRAPLLLKGVVTDKLQVCKWYNLVIFTASVQEYADPVIDWLESERKFFSARYYRQHCTFRHGAFIKDLSSVEPDLSKVMILDNSPLSYMFHQGELSSSFMAKAKQRFEVLTRPDRQRDSDPGLDQRPDGQRLAAPGAHVGGAAVRVRRACTAGVEGRRGRAAHGMTQIGTLRRVRLWTQRPGRGTGLECGDRVFLGVRVCITVFVDPGVASCSFYNSTLEARDAMGLDGVVPRNRSC